MNLIVTTYVKHNMSMCELIYPFVRVCGQIVEVCLDDMFDVMEGVRHILLESDSNIFKDE
jgi:hypothetical protein